MQEGRVRVPYEAPEHDVALVAGAADRVERLVARAEFAGERHERRGRSVRTEGEIDPRSRMVQAIAKPEMGTEEIIRLALQAMVNK